MNLGPVLVDVATKDLKDAALDWVVAHLEGAQVAIVPGGLIFGVGGGCPCRYSSDWSQGGPLIDKYNVEIIRFGEQAFYERDPQWNQKPCVGAVIRHAPRDTVSGDIDISECMTGETRLIAVCRAIVAWELGDIVKVPALLVLP